MVTEVVADRLSEGDWRVESIDDDGRCYVTIFTGPEAESRARSYGAWLDGEDVAVPAEGWPAPDRGGKRMTPRKGANNAHGYGGVLVRQ